MAYVPITSSQVDAKSPIDEQLMGVGLKDNLSDHEARLLALEASLGSGGGGSDLGSMAEILGGMQTNEARYKRRRFSAFQTSLKSGEKIDEAQTGFDPEGSLESLFLQTTKNGYQGTITSNAKKHLGVSLQIGKNLRRTFRLPKGYNAFGIVCTFTSLTSDSVTVTIDGASVTTKGLTDETGTAQTNTFSTNNATTQYQRTTWFFGLDGQEHMIEITNTDSASKILEIEAIEIVYRTPNGQFTIDHNLHVEKGVASIRGYTNVFDATTLSFPAAIGGGYTGAVVGDKTGLLTAVSNGEPTMTQALPDIELDWTTGFSSMRVKSSTLFPSKGFLFVIDYYGRPFMASYTSKTETSSNTQQFNGLIFKAPPTDKYTPLNNFLGSAGQFYGDVNINLWATADSAIEITSLNNKIDFKITINGTQTSHTATIASGLYGADLIPLEAAVVTAMNAVKSLASVAGQYFCEWNESNQKWIIGARGVEIDSIAFDFSSGASVANSVHPSLGFTTTDLSGQKSYLANTAKQHKPCRIMAPGEFMGADHPQLVFYPGHTTASETEIRNISSRLGFGQVYETNVQASILIITTDPDTVGMSLHFIPHVLGNTISVQIDHGNVLYLLQTEGAESSSTRGRIISTFISFPRGTKSIVVRTESDGVFEEATGSHHIRFLGAIPYYTRPPVERLTLDQAIIKAIDVAPKQMYRTYYCPNSGGMYTPQATKDNVDTISFSGSWTTSGSGGGGYAFYYRNSSTLDSYMDVTFTLQGDGGGIGIKGQAYSGGPAQVNSYLVDGATASESNSLIQKTHYKWLSGSLAYNNMDFLEVTGLKAGQYTLRYKLKAANNIYIMALSIMDTVPPDPTATLVTELANNQQGLAMPMHAKKFPILLDGVDLVPAYLSRSGYREGNQVIDYAEVANTFTTFQENETLRVDQHLFGGYVSSTSVGLFVRSFEFCKSLFSMDMIANPSATVQANITGRNTASTYLQIDPVKAGAGIGSNYKGLGNCVVKNFYYNPTSNMSNSTTIPGIADTRGIVKGMTVQISADGQPTETRIVDTVTNDTSFTITKAISGFANYTTANKLKVTFYGFHTLKLTPTTTGAFYLTGIGFVPLDLAPSKWTTRLKGKKVTEVESRTFYGAASGDDLYYPVFSDGTRGDFRNTVISVIGQSADSVYTFPENLRDIVVSTGTIDVKLTSTKEVYIYEND